jgi:hypothetical protein
MRRNAAFSFLSKISHGRVAERFKALVLKTSVGSRPPWVRIPPLPPITDLTPAQAIRETLKKPRKLFDVRGLSLKVMPNGGPYWRFNYRFNGKQKTLTLGTYPDVSLANARERRHEARRQLANGIDPGAIRQAVSRDFEEARCPGDGPTAFGCTFSLQSMT